MKKFGYSILDRPEGSSSRIAHLMKMHRGYSYILCAGDGYVDHLAQGFNVNKDIIKILPLPRVELLQDKEYIKKKQNEIYSAYPELDPDKKGKKNIVYVPTFRKEDDADFDEAVNRFAEALDTGKYNLVVKAHPLSGYHGQKFKNRGRFLTCDEFTSMDMLLVADAVVSDYSCVIYEAAVLMKPLYFYTYDYDEYMSTRDIYMDYKKEVPGPMCDDAASLAAAIDDMDAYDYGRLASFLKLIVPRKHRQRQLSATGQANVKHIAGSIRQCVFLHLLMSLCVLNQSFISRCSYSACKVLSLRAVRRARSLSPRTLPLLL